MAVIDCNIFAASLRLKTDVKVILPFYPTDDVANGKREDIFPTGKKYQVLWLLHGGNGAGSELLQAEQLLQNLRERGNRRH